MRVDPVSLTLYLSACVLTLLGRCNTIILEVIEYETTPSEVRRFALLNIPLTPSTLSHIVTRTRDVETSVRIYIYATVLSPPPTTMLTKCRTYPSSYPFNRLQHPRQLTIAQREKIVRDGLSDREDKVRAAAEKMLGAWYDKVMESTSEECQGILTPVEFLKLFDVASNEGAPIAADALSSILVTRPHVLETLSLDGEKMSLDDVLPVFSLTLLNRCFLAESLSRECPSRSSLHRPHFVPDERRKASRERLLACGHSIRILYSRSL